MVTSSIRVDGQPTQSLVEWEEARDGDQETVLAGWVREVAHRRSSGRRRAASGGFPEDSVARLGTAIQNFNWIAAVLPEDEASRAEVVRRFDFVVAQMSCAELETGLRFGSSPQTQRVEWKWWRSDGQVGDAAPATRGPQPDDPFEPLRRGQAGRVTLAIREGSPQILFALRQLLRLIPTQDIEFHPLPPESG